VFKKKKIVYLSHKYRNNPYKNYLKVRFLAKRIVVEFDDIVVIAPHLYLCHIIDEEVNGGKCMEWCLNLLSFCDEMYVFGFISEGVQEELDFCENEKNFKGNKIKVIKADDELYKLIGVNKQFIEGE